MTTIDYRGFKLQSSGNNRTGWICFIDRNDPLIRPQKTEAKALANGKALVDLFYEDTEASAIWQRTAKNEIYWKVGRKPSK